ncbi:uncharacterized protein LOC134728457 [Pan paniscus]|uniref:uncharacterized protein LOC134728457 n=1 Tax=Pan paniscus TaxID=9597 RepID=UPI0015619EBF
MCTSRPHEAAHACAVPERDTLDHDLTAAAVPVTWRSRLRAQRQSRPSPEETSDGERTGARGRRVTGFISGSKEEGAAVASDFPKVARTKSSSPLSWVRIAAAVCVRLSPCGVLSEHHVLLRRDVSPGQHCLAGRMPPPSPGPPPDKTHGWGPGAPHGRCLGPFCGKSCSPRRLLGRLSLSQQVKIWEASPRSLEGVRWWVADAAGPRCPLTFSFTPVSVTHSQLQPRIQKSGRKSLTGFKSCCSEQRDEPSHRRVLSCLGRAPSLRPASPCCAHRQPARGHSTGKCIAYKTRNHLGLWAFTGGLGNSPHPP